MSKSFVGPERKSSFFEQQIAGCPADQRVLLGVANEMLPKLFYSHYQRSRPRRSAADAAIRSSSG